MAITPERYGYQAEEGRRWWQMQVDSGAWGSFAWWYPGGFRLGANSDCGFVDPSNVPRPVAQVGAQFVGQFAGAERRAADSFLDFAPEANIGGWVGEYLDKREEYAKRVAAGHVVDVRTAGLGTSSQSCPLVDCAGQPHPGKGPLRHLDAIFESVRVRVENGKWQRLGLPPEPGAVVEVRLPAGKAVELEAWAGNLAEALWLAGAPDAAGTVSLLVSGDADLRLPLEAATPFHGSGHFGPARVTAKLDGPLTLRLQLDARDRAAFGEAVTVRLVPREG